MVVSRRGFRLVHPLVTNAEPRDDAPTRQRPVQRLTVGLPTDDDVTHARVRDGAHERAFLGWRRLERKSGRGREYGFAASILWLIYKND